MHLEYVVVNASDPFGHPSRVLDSVIIKAPQRSMLRLVSNGSPASDDDEDYHEGKGGLGS